MKIPEKLAFMKRKESLGQKEGERGSGRERKGSKLKDGLRDKSPQGGAWWPSVAERSGVPLLLETLQGCFYESLGGTPSNMSGLVSHLLRL